MNGAVNVALTIGEIRTKLAVVANVAIAITTLILTWMNRAIRKMEVVRNVFITQKDFNANIASPDISETPKFNRVKS